MKENAYILMFSDYIPIFSKQDSTLISLNLQWYKSDFSY